MQTESLMDRQIEGRQMEVQTDEQMVRQSDRHINGQVDRQMGRQVHTHTD
jgi:hypothetical protein